MKMKMSTTSFGLKSREYATASCINFVTLILSRRHLKERNSIKQPLTNSPEPFAL